MAYQRRYRLHCSQGNLAQSEIKGLILELLEGRSSPLPRGGWMRLGWDVMGSHIQVNQLCLALCLCWKRWWQRSLQGKEAVVATVLGSQGSVGQRHQALLSTPNGKASLPKCDFRQRKKMHFLSHHCHHPAHTQGPAEEEWVEPSYERIQTHLLVTLCYLGKINESKNKCLPGAWQCWAFSFYTFPRLSRGNCLGGPCNATEVGRNEWRDLVCPSYHVIPRHIFYQPCTPLSCENEPVLTHLTTRDVCTGQMSLTPIPHPSCFPRT